MHRVAELVRQRAEAHGRPVEVHHDERGCPRSSRGERAAHLPCGRIHVDPALLEAAAPDGVGIRRPERLERRADPLDALLVLELRRGSSERRCEVVRSDPVDAVDPLPQPPVAVPGGQVRLERCDQVVEDLDGNVRPGERRRERRLVAADARLEHRLLDRAGEVRRQRVAHAQVAVGVALPGALPQRPVRAREQHVDRALGDVDLRPVGRHGRREDDIAVGERAVNTVRPGEDVRHEPEHLLDLGGAGVGSTPAEIGEVVVVCRQRRIARGPVAEPVGADREHLGLDERDGRPHLRVGGLGTAEARHRRLVGRLDGVAEQGVDEDLARPAHDRVARLQGLDENCGALAEAAAERREPGEVGEHGLELRLPGLDGREDAGVVPGAIGGDAVARDRHRGMLPCLRFGVGSRFARCISSARIRYGRVVRGSITSSTYPRSAAEYGLANRSW